MHRMLATWYFGPPLICIMTFPANRRLFATKWQLNAQPAHQLIFSAMARLQIDIFRHGLLEKWYYLSHNVSIFTSCHTFCLTMWAFPPHVTHILSHNVSIFTSQGHGSLAHWYFSYGSLAIWYSWQAMILQQMQRFFFNCNSFTANFVPFRPPGSLIITLLQNLMVFCRIVVHFLRSQRFCCS